MFLYYLYRDCSLTFIFLSETVSQRLSRPPSLLLCLQPMEVRTYEKEGSYFSVVWLTIYMYISSKLSNYSQTL